MYYTGYCTASSYEYMHIAIRFCLISQLFQPVRSYVPSYWSQLSVQLARQLWTYRLYS